MEGGADDHAWLVVFFAEADALIGFTATADIVVFGVGEVGTVVGGRTLIRGVRGGATYCCSAGRVQAAGRAVVIAAASMALRHCPGRCGIEVVFLMTGALTVLRDGRNRAMML